MRKSIFAEQYPIRNMSESFTESSGVPNGEVSLREVAAAAGVSLSTASRALSGRGRCSAATRERIQALAETMGYVPDPGRSALIRARWQQGVNAGAQWLPS